MCVRLAQVIRHERYSKKADVFSYGMLLFELLTHQVRVPHGLCSLLRRKCRSAHAPAGRAR
eukprot:1131634-Prymnesium_polylepis.1